MNPARLLVLVPVALLAACASGPVGDPFQPGPAAAAPATSPAPAMAAAPASAPAAPATESAQYQNMDLVKMHVDGMSCPSRCPREVRAMLASVPGIIGTPMVDTGTQTVTCYVEKGTDPQTLVAAIKSPYRARLL